MNVIINRQPSTLPDNCNLTDAIKTVKNIPTKGVAVAVNNDVVTASDWEKTILKDGDTVTIIRAFYGG